MIMVSLGLEKKDKSPTFGSRQPDNCADYFNDEIKILKNSIFPTGQNQILS